MEASAIRFDDQVVIVTGAGRGLGRAHARGFGACGAHVIVHDAGVSIDGGGHDPSVADAVVAEIREAGGQATAAYEDLAERTSCESLVARVAESFGRLDVLVSNAGIVAYAGIEDTDASLWERIRRVNVEAPLWLSRAAFVPMTRRRHGRIVITISGHGMYVSRAPDLTAYAVSKAALYGLMNTLAGEGDPLGIRVNAISPVAATRMLRRTVEPGEAAPELVTPGVLFLASLRCDFSGVVLRATDGFFSVGRYMVSEGVQFGRTPADPEMIALNSDRISGGPPRTPS